MVKRWMQIEMDQKWHAKFYFFTPLIHNVSSIKFIFMEKDSCIQVLCRLIREKIMELFQN
jgi:hypothetical protein